MDHQVYQVEMANQDSQAKREIVVILAHQDYRAKMAYQDSKVNLDFQDSQA